MPFLTLNQRVGALKSGAVIVGADFTALNTREKAAASQSTQLRAIRRIMQTIFDELSTGVVTRSVR